MCADRLDDVATPPAAPEGATEADPFAVFRHDRLPEWALVRQRFDPAEIGDVDAAVAAAIEPLAATLPASGVACVALGSRGIDRIDEVALGHGRRAAPTGSRCRHPRDGQPRRRHARGPAPRPASLGITRSRSAARSAQHGHRLPR
jgi:hypothetical protein